MSRLYEEPRKVCAAPTEVLADGGLVTMGAARSAARADGVTQGVVSPPGTSP